MTNNSVELIGKWLRDQSDEVMHAPLPRRWVDLINHLDEQERASGANPSNEKRSRAELAVNAQEKVLIELQRVGEPSDEAKALLEDLRRRAAQAVTKRP